MSGEERVESPSGECLVERGEVEEEDDDVGEGASDCPWARP